MKTKKIIPCLDIKNGKVVKGVKFQNVSDVASPIELASYYNKSGADEIAFYDITASTENRMLFTDLLKEVSDVVSVPLIVGGGISTIADFENVLLFGASKVSINSGALNNESLISEAAKKYGSSRIVLSVDVKMVSGKYNIFKRGGTEDAKIDAIEWIKKMVDSGAGEVVVNSIDNDGVKNGFDLELLSLVLQNINAPIIASGGAGKNEHFLTLFNTLPAISAGLAASVFHFGDIKINELKEYLFENGISVRRAENGY